MAGHWGGGLDLELLGLGKREARATALIGTKKKKKKKKKGRKKKKEINK